MYGSFGLARLPSSPVPFSHAPGAYAAPKADHYESDCSFVSRLLFTHVGFLHTIQTTRQFDLDDLWQLPNDHKCRLVTHRLQQRLDHNQTLLRSFLQLEWRAVGCSALLVAMSIPFRLAPVVLVYVMLHMLQGRPEQPMHLAMFLAAFHGAFAVSVLLDCHAVSLISRAASRTGSACHALLLRGIITNTRAAHKEELASITNLYGSGISLMIDWIASIHDIWVYPVQIAAQIYVLNRVLDVNWQPMGVLFGVLGLMVWMSAMIDGWLRSRTDRERAKRWKVVNECFRAILTVKLHAWEARFATRINATRISSRKSVGYYLIALACCRVVSQCGAEIVVGLYFFFIVAKGQPFNPAIAFASILVGQLVRQSASGLYTAALQLLDGYRAMKSLEMEFVGTRARKTARSPIARINCGKYLPDVVAAGNMACLGYDPNKPEFVLLNVNFSISRGELVVVHGKAGSGKSTLLNALIGEAMCYQGELYVSGECRVAYCSQEPWMQSLTIRENILFGSPYEERKYFAVLGACCLIEDLCMLPNGDKTVVGPRGINLSGGQRARIALARACYSDADLYVLDCPLSSVDAAVQMDVFRKCMVELLRYKTVVLSTHSAEVIHSRMVDRLFKMDQMTITIEKGTTTSNESKCVSCRVQAFESSFWRCNRDEVTTDKLNTCTRSLLLDGFDMNESTKNRLFGSATTTDSWLVIMLERNKVLDMRSTMSTVRILFRRGLTVRVLFASAGLCAITFALSMAAKNLWLAWWSSQCDLPRQTSIDRAITYAAILLGGFVVLLIGQSLISLSVIRVVDGMFRDLVRSLLNAPLSLYYHVAMGEVLRRFVVDVEVCDYYLAPELAATLVFGALIIGSVAVLTLLLGWAGIVIVVVVASCGVTMGLSKAFAQVQLLTSKARTSDMARFAESLEGLAVIRAFGKHAVDAFVRQHEQIIDNIHRIRILWLCLNNSGAWRLSYLHGLVMAVLMMVVSSSTAAPAALGLTMTYVAEVYHHAYALFVSGTNVLVMFTNLKLLLRFGTIPPEEHIKHPPAIQQHERHHSNWPTVGRIEFDHVYFRYDGLTDVLKDVSFTIEKKAKIGVVGRTGSGKSSLAMALFRVHELVQGRILIDGTDIRSLPLQVLRSSLSIIPQSPMFYRCVVREYLDPFDEFTDHDLWQVVHKTGLSPFVQTLQTELHENGENWSLGQRQLLCLARSLLRPSKIVILDDPFSSIDGESDKQLLSVLSSELRESTVLFVTHRLDQVLTFCEKILVLKDGEVEDFGVVEELVGRSDGVFFELLENTLLTR